MNYSREGQVYIYIYIYMGGGSHSEIGHYRIGLVWSVPPPLLLVGEFSIT